MGISIKKRMTKKNRTNSGNKVKNKKRIQENIKVLNKIKNENYEKI